MADRLEERVDPSDWPDALARVTGPQLVVAGPGTGKTEFLVRRTLHLVEGHGIPPERILLLSFSRRGAADLKARVSIGLGRSFTEVSAFTFHGLAHRLLEAHGGVPQLLTGPEQVALVHALLTTEDPKQWPLPYRGLLNTQTFANEVADFLLRCRELLIGPDALADRAAERSDWRRLPGFLVRYQEALTGADRIDYGSLQARGVELLADAEMRSRVGARYPFILVDEYQDTTVAQATLLGLLYSTHHNLTVAGDPYQSIYSFRGARLGNIAAFPEDFPDAYGGRARRMVLTTSFRVPAEILDAAVRVTAGGRLPGAAGPVAPASHRGSVEVYTFDQQTHEAEWIATTLERIRLRERIPYRRMAVLVRSKRRFLPELSRALQRRNIPHETPNARLADHPAVRVILDCVDAAIHPGSEEAIRRVLLGPLLGLPLSAMRDLQRHKIGRGVTWPEAITEMVPEGASLAAFIDDPTWASGVPAAEGFWNLWSGLPAFAATVVDPRRRGDRTAWSSFAQVLSRLGERDPTATLADYLMWSDSEDFEATPLLEYRASGEDRLALTTLHQAKGLEFEVVVIADARDGTFPDLRPRESLLGTRHLAEGFMPGLEYGRFRLQEEMRLAYTAMTRATRRVIWTCTTLGAEDGSGVPSRFLPLVAGAATIEDAVADPDLDPRPATPLEAEAWLRRTLRDPSEPGAMRWAALGALVSGGSWRPRAPAEFAGMLEAGADDGLVPPDATLSPSQADDYLACPRQYAFRRRLHVDSGRTVYLDLGILIHDVLETAESHALDAGAAHASLQDAMAALSERWDPAPFGAGPWGEAWKRRAERIITHLYETWPSRGAVAHVEHDVALEIEGTRWRGRIDRIETEERPTERPLVRIVDYKTGSTAMPAKQAATSVQLGFYLLAGAADPGIADLGEVASAEFWYPGVTTKGLTTRRFDPARIGEVEERMAEAAAGIKGEDWTARPGEACARCPVRSTCPEWPEGREAYLG
jgi:superfamily I DNA/RNA helicase/RecB family exonuclease